MENLILYGNGSFGNHGCEAIIRGTFALLPTKHFIIISDNIEEDKKYLSDEPFELREAKLSPKKNVSYLKAYLSLKFKKNYLPLDGLQYITQIKKSYKDSRIALSVGGDNYCYGDNRIYGYLNKAYKNYGLKTVLWGCSIEPTVVEKTAEDLIRYDLIVARESITYHALKKIGANVLLSPDPAFFMNPKPIALDMTFNNQVIGINISPLIQSCESQKGITYRNYKKLIQYILENTNCSIALIPHVVWSNNDDRKPLHTLYEEFYYDDRIFLIKDHSADELKYIISQCTFFVGARTHATIAAYSSGIPTLVVGYSVKARGIALDLFGSIEDYVLPVQELKNDSDLCEAFLRLFSRKEEIQNHLNSFLPQYLRSASKATEELTKLI